MLQSEFDLEPAGETADLAEHISHGRVQHALEGAAIQKRAEEGTDHTPGNPGHVLAF